MVRLVGTLLLSFSVWLVGSCKSRTLKHKMNVEDGLLSLVEHIKSVIRAQGLALCDIYCTVKDERLDMPNFYKTLHGGKCNSLLYALDTVSTKDCDKRLCDCVKSFAEAVGNSYCSEDAVVLCDKYLELMRTRISQVREEDKKREGLYSKLGFISACAVFVLCI